MANPDKPNVSWFRSMGVEPILRTIRNWRRVAWRAGKPSSLVDWHKTHNACCACHGRGLQMHPPRGGRAWDTCNVCDGSGLYGDGAWFVWSGNGKAGALMDVTNPKRRLLLRLRRQIKVRTRQCAIASGLDKRTVWYRCKRCGAVQAQVMVSEFAARWATLWHSERGGNCTGICPVCTKRVRDERYPLKGVC